MPPSHFKKLEIKEVLTTVLFEHFLRNLKSKDKNVKETLKPAHILR